MASWKKDSSGNWKKSESKKKNYTIVDGKKVEKTEAAKTAPSTSSDTWRKDSVSLEEAAQQSKDVERGVIDVDKGTTTIEAPVQTERISLEQAAQQTQTEQRVLAAETAQAEQRPMEVTGTVATTTEYDPNTGEYVRRTVRDTESTYQNLSTIKAGSNIKSAAQLDPITVRKQETETRTTNIKDTPLGRLNTSRIAAEDLKQEDATSIRELTTEENASLKKSLLVDQTLTAEDTLQNATSAKSRELAGAYAQQETKLYEASRLGAIEPAATKYESIVSSLIAAEAKTLDKVNVVDKVTGKKINQPVADFILSAGEALALTPVSTARMAASAVRDPLGTARAAVEQPIVAIRENPAKGLGSLAGAVVGGVAIAKVAGVGGAKAGKVADVGKSATLEARSTILKAAEPKKATVTELKAVDTPKTTSRTQYFEIGEKILQEKISTLKKAGAEKSEVSFYESELVKVKQSKSLQMLMDESASTYLPEIATKRRPVKQMVMEKPKMTQAEFNKLMSNVNAPGRRGRRVNFRTNKDLMAKARKNVELRKATKADKGAALRSTLPATARYATPAKGAEVVAAPAVKTGSSLKPVVRQSQQPITAPKIKQSARQTTSQLQDTVVKEAVKTPSKPTRSTRKGVEFPRRPVVPPMEIAPTKPRSSGKKASKTKVKKETIKNVYVDPMKALGRKKL